jgi:hypothetical protein
MRVVFEVDNIVELEEISEWLSQKKIVIQQIGIEKINADVLFNRLKSIKIELPADYRFNRDEANER